MADTADGAARLSLLDMESAWRRLARGCFESPFGPPARLVSLGGHPFVAGR